MVFPNRSTRLYLRWMDGRCTPPLAGDMHVLIFKNERNNQSYTVGKEGLCTTYHIQLLYEGKVWKSWITNWGRCLPPSVINVIYDCSFLPFLLWCVLCTHVCVWSCGAGGTGTCLREGVEEYSLGLGVLPVFGACESNSGHSTWQQAPLSIGPSWWPEFCFPVPLSLSHFTTSQDLDFMFQLT